METKDIKDVEIFAVGNWNGDDYTESDLDEMVRAFNENQSTLKPYLKLGHDGDQKLLQNDGLPSAGWITKLKRVGEKLVADFSQVPKTIYELIKNGAYKKVSSEIYWDIKVNGQNYKRFLSGVALLGSDMPAVSNLSDILGLYTLENVRKYTENVEEAILKTYDYPSKGNNKMEKELQELKDQLAVKEAELNKYTADTKNKDKEIDALKADIKQFSQKLDDETNKRIQTEQERFVDGLKEVTPAMRPYALALIGEEKKSYSIKDKEYSKQEMLKEILKLYSASLVNLEENSEEGDKHKDTKEAEMQKYISEGKSAREAYKLVNA